MATCPWQRQQRNQTVMEEVETDVTQQCSGRLNLFRFFNRLWMIYPHHNEILITAQLHTIYTMYQVGKCHF